MISNNINDKVYIGLTKKDINERFESHIDTTRKIKKYAIHHAMLKYGIENFMITLIEQTPDILRECYWINYYNSFDEGYNLTMGGDGTYGYNLSEIQRRVRSDNTKRLHKSKSVGMYGKKQSQKQKQIVSDIMKGCKRRIDNLCVHCGKYFDTGNYRRWHGDNCKLNENI